MARIRTIKPEFVESESVGKLSRDARLLFVLLWTFVDDEGRARASSRLLASRLYPYDDEAVALIDGWLDELEQGGHVRRYVVEGDAYLDIPKWLKHQKIDHPSKSRLPEFSGSLARPRESVAPHTLDLGPVPRTKDLGPREGADAPPRPPKPENIDGKFKLPSDWRPDAQGRAYAQDRGLSPDDTADVFVDHFTCRKGKSERRDARGWGKRWEAWCRLDAARPVGRAPARPVQSPRGNDAFFDQLADIAAQDRAR